MYSHPIKKLFGLFILYAAIIIGIFVLQFKSESIFSESIGVLRFTFTKTENSQGSVLKNSLQAAFKGILFYFDDKNPVTIRKSDSDSVNDITLLSWNKATPLSSTFQFSNDVSLTFTVSNSTDSADLSIQADFPKDVESISLNFKPTKGYHITDRINSSIKIEAPNSKFVLTGIDSEDEKITIFKNHPVALYSPVSDSQVFTFDTSGSYALSSSETFVQNIKSMETNIVTLFRDALQNNTMLTEQSVITYVAIMAKNGQYNSALDTVPDVFKKGQKRTYLSAPYFNTLEKMYTTLQMHNDNLTRLVTQAVEQNSCDIFTVTKLTDFILQNKNKEIVKKLLSLPSNVQPENINPSQASGILHIYTDMLEYDQQLADFIPLSTIDSCLEIIAKACTIREDNQKLMISENNSQFTPVHALETGNTLIRYGRKIQDASLVNTGYLLVNSYFTDISASDLYTYSEIYPILIRDNSYYPHFSLIGEDDGNIIWAWTCASNINYTKDENSNTIIDVVFPQGLTHYIMIGGIPAFQKIQIYGIDFRTDARFEMYNSSGYVHIKSSDMLLLKSRHRNETETVKLFYVNQE